MKRVEKARISDVPEMHKLINYFAEKGEMLARPLSEIYENMRDYFVVRDGERVIAKLDNPLLQSQAARASPLPVHCFLFPVLAEA